MLSNGIAKLRELVPKASVTETVFVLLSLLRQYTTGLSLAIAADELSRITTDRCARKPEILRGRIERVTYNPLHTWFITSADKNSISILAYVHSHFKHMPNPTKLTVRVLTADTSAFEQSSPAAVEAAANDAFPEPATGPGGTPRRCRLLLPTPALVFEREHGMHINRTVQNGFDEAVALSLQDVWDKREQHPEAVRGEVVSIDKSEGIILLTDDVNYEDCSTQPCVTWRLGTHRQFARLIAVGETLLFEKPVVIPTGNSFELAYGTNSIAWILVNDARNERGNGIHPRAAKRARLEPTPVTPVLDMYVYLWDAQRSQKCVHETRASGIVNVRNLKRDFVKEQVFITGAFGEHVIVMHADFAKQTWDNSVPLGCALWIENAVWNAGEDSWIATAVPVNISALPGVLHAPFVRYLQELNELRAMACRSHACTVQTCLRIVRVNCVRNERLQIVARNVSVQKDFEQNGNDDNAYVEHFFVTEAALISIYYMKEETLRNIAEKEDGENALQSVVKNVSHPLFVSVAMNCPQNASEHDVQLVICAAAKAPGNY